MAKTGLLQHFSNVNVGVVVGMRWDSQVWPGVVHPAWPREGQARVVEVEARCGGGAGGRGTGEEQGMVEFCSARLQTWQQEQARARDEEATTRRKHVPGMRRQVPGQQLLPNQRQTRGKE